MSYQSRDCTSTVRVQHGCNTSVVQSRASAVPGLQSCITRTEPGSDLGTRRRCRSEAPEEPRSGPLPGDPRVGFRRLPRRVDPQIATKVGAQVAAVARRKDFAAARLAARCSRTATLRGVLSTWRAWLGSQLLSRMAEAEADLRKRTCSQLRERMLARHRGPTSALLVSLTFAAWREARDHRQAAACGLRARAHEESADWLLGRLALRAWRVSAATSASARLCSRWCDAVRTSKGLVLDQAFMRHQQVLGSAGGQLRGLLLAEVVQGVALARREFGSRGRPRFCSEVSVRGTSC